MGSAAAHTPSEGGTGLAPKSKGYIVPKFKANTRYALQGSRYHRRGVATSDVRGFQPGPDSVNRRLGTGALGFPPQEDGDGEGPRRDGMRRGRDRDGYDALGFDPSGFNETVDSRRAPR